MATLSQIHDGRPVVEDQIHGWRSQEKVWQNFAVLVAVLLKEHGDDGSHAGLAQAIADLAAHLADTGNPHGVTAVQAGAAPSTHVGEGGTAHAAVSSSAAGFATPAMLAKQTEHGDRLTELEKKPWGGAFTWDGSRWTCPRPVGVAAVGSRLGAGLCEVAFGAALPSVDHYRVAITQHAGSDPAILQVEKLVDRVVIQMKEPREFAGVDAAGFDLTIHPID